MKCESDGLVYTSIPPKSRCKYCKGFWSSEDEVPECQARIKPSEKIIAAMDAMVDRREKFLKKNIFERGMDDQEKLIQLEMLIGCIIDYLDEQHENATYINKAGQESPNQTEKR